MSAIQTQVKLFSMLTSLSNLPILLLSWKSKEGCLIMFVIAWFKKHRLQIAPLVALLLMAASLLYLSLKYGDDYQYVGMYESITSSHNQDANRPELQSDDPKDIKSKQLVDDYKKKPTPNVILQGRYSGKYFDDQEETLTFVFGDDNSLTKIVRYGENRHTTGKATYKFNGSTLEFTNITGQPRLFPSAGEAIVVNDLDSVTLPAFNYLRLKRE
ncbi:hypothetical protein [Aeromonas veronii]|uniref:Uncharacterized protein n=1 Tax=Aeromonas veronii TaxID=654 RepID=A0A4S5CKA3_AERVE|nr:hypothetical protein [Aeromonas veronii]THJ45091.1 hypothetical protein E8Q35_12990 [Aeromonas veronii]